MTYALETGKSKTRLLHPRIAAVVASLRHGEMIFVSDAGSGSSAKALTPLDPGVEYIDIGVATGVPSFQDVVGALCEVGDFEAAVVASNMKEENAGDYAFLVDIFGQELVHEVEYRPDFYDLRDRAKAMVQTGDCGLLTNVVLVGGYPSPNIPLSRLTRSEPTASQRSGG